MANFSFRNGLWCDILETALTDNVILSQEKILVESLERWREEMGIEEMVLCGHSLGGMMSCAYAMAHPNRC